MWRGVRCWYHEGDDGLLTYKMLDEFLYCPHCEKDRQLCKVSWMHHWKRCNYCLLKLPRKETKKGDQERSFEELIKERQRKNWKPRTISNRCFRYNHVDCKGKYCKCECHREKDE